ncbi:protein hobbit [Galleria mellonella]|uniref:Protein hobbit n=1 Tax=Galleria mellonella TaxID=7137 RepID=A0ABM3N1I9_GALME|nr:protein hobbit [Galleria mellonella]XP_052757446.1 protein hobbit [Galleria mellonella]XP_052757447.1 protein hobbit [Galleria mellonella]
MNIFFILLFIFVAIYSCVSWLLPALLSWLFKRKYHIRLKIGRIAVLKFILKDVSLSKDRYFVHIDEISFRSSFFSSEINKLVSVVIKGVEITNHVEEKRSVVVETILKPLLSKQNSVSRSEGDEQVTNLSDVNSELSRIVQKKILDFRDKKLPPSLIMFAQFMGVHMFNVSITIQNGATNNASLNVSASEVHADGAAGGPARALVFSANLVEVRGKVFTEKHCLGEASCSLLVEGTVKADGPLNVEKIHAVVSNTTISFQDEIYQFIQKHKRHRKDLVKSDLVGEDHMKTIIPRLSPVIPKIFSLKVDTTKIKCLNSATKTNFEMSLQSIQVISRFSAASVIVHDSGTEVTGLPQVYVAFQMDQYQLMTDNEKLLFLHKLKLDAKLEKDILNLYLIISTLRITYNHSQVFEWYSTVMERVRKSKALEVKPVNIKESSTPVWMSRLFASCVVQGCAELREVKIHTRLLEEREMSVGCTGVKVKLDQLLDTKESQKESPGRGQWSAELLVDGGWAAWRGARPGAAPPRRRHAWGSALLAVALVKWGSHGRNNSKVEAMMDCLRLEWSPSIAKTIITLADSLNQYRSTSSSNRPSLPSADYPPNITVNVALSHINLFLIVNEKMCLMTRIDAVTLEKTASKSGAVVSGLKVVDMVPYEGTMHCYKSDEIVSSFFYIRLARIEYVPSKQRHSALLDFQFMENVDFEWSVNLHLKILTLCRAIKSFIGELKEKWVRSTETVAKRGRELDWRIAFKGDTNLMLILSKENNMLFATDDLTISYDHEIGLSIVWSLLKMVLNGDEVITVEGYSMERVADDHDVRVERKANEGFELMWNKVWLVSVDSVRVIFPYKHRFADAVQGDFVTLFKWIKLVHGIQKKSVTADSPLPSDLHIKIEEILIEMSDDPFEVKLRDNYELLEDEYKESQKRRTMLDAKVQELCKPHLFLPSGKVEELYAALRQKDAQIYVQRCRAAPAPRRRLVACTLARLRLLALADPSLHGAAALPRLRRMDADSPWPEDGLEFWTLWCRAVSLSCAQWQLLLRDFPQPLLSMSQLRLWGTLLGAEEAPPSRAVRTVAVEQGEPWGAVQLERSMMPLKCYYDVCCEMAQFSYAFGPCWEPVIAHCNLAFDQVSRPSLDPSAPLAWWDKVRLLMHGRLTVNCARFTCLLHVSLDPYNTTEEMEVTWTDLVLDWTNGKIGFLGELNVFVRTASKYDDCRVLSLPALRLALKLGWQTVGDPRDHHAVAPCAPTRLPEYSSNQEHDSYRAFRSQGLDVHLSMDTKPIDGEGPVVLLYGSTLRWFESLKLIVSGVTRPTRRGRVFRNVRPRRPQLSRHYRNLSVSLTLHNLQVFYWSSSSMQRGIEMLGVRVTCSSKHRLSLVAANDGLVRRPRANWTTVYMNCDLNDAEIWLKTPATVPDDRDSDEAGREGAAGGRAGPAMEKCYCLSVRRVSYGRGGAGGSGGAAGHRLAVHDLRGAWTKLNRDLAFALIDTYIKTQQLKKNLSTKALKEEENPETSPMHQREADVVSPPPNATQSGGSGAGAGAGGSGMLAALVAEAGGEAPVVFSDELAGDGAAPPPHAPHAPHARHLLDDDAAVTACLIELVNSQVVLKGCETRGYVILCAARAEVRQRVRRGAAGRAGWSGWSGALTAMQYYATVSAGDTDQLDENIQWVSVEEISERWAGAEISALPDVPRLVGSGQAAGGVIGRTVGPSCGAAPAQLQRVVSRCACEFYYVAHAARPPAAWPPAAAHQPYDSFTLMHHDLDVCTNSLQYAMVLDVVNNVVLHVEPERRRTLERRARMRFQLRLHQDQDPRHLIHKLQTQVRESLARLRRLEKEYYLKNRSITGNDPVALEELKNLDDQVNECKESVWSLGEELDAMVRAWREVRAAAAAPAPRLPHAPPHRYNEICFKSARWRLTDADGQLGIADLLLTNFLYTKTSRSDDSVEHQLEVGYMRVTNLLPNEPFPEVLVPATPSGRAAVARRAALRVFCRDRPPVGGIAVKEHFEVNIVPIKIGLTKKFFNTMLKFCFPERDPDSIEDGDDEDGTLKASTSTATLVSTGSKKVKKKNKDSNSNFYVKRDKKDKDDVEKMKERAEKNKLFIYIKIPEVPVRVSYKGSKEKNLEDVRDLPLVLPTLEYHNVTWTWLDLLLATKTDTRRVIVSQAIRQKLQLRRSAATAPEPLEEDKARLLLGERTVTENKPQKKSTPSVFKFSKS